MLNTLRRDARRLSPERRVSLAMALPSPRFWPVLLFRVCFACRRWPLRLIAFVLALANRILFRVEIALDTPIGPGLFIPHGNVIIGARSIGEDFSIFSGAVVGSRSGNLNDPAKPIGDDRATIGAGVTMYSNAVIAGPVTIADGVRIAACVLVTESVLEPNAVVASAVPRIIARSS
jgi:serine O-acetyltransferase